MTSTRFFLDARVRPRHMDDPGHPRVLGLAYAVRRVPLLAALSLFFAFLLFPAVRLVERWLGPRRLLAIAIVYLALLVALGGAAFAVGPRLSTEAQSLAQKLPDMTTRIQSGAVFGELLQRHGWQSSEIRELERLVQTHMGEIIGYAQQATAALVTWLTGAWVIVLIPVFAVFILKDVERLMSTAIWRLGPRGSRGMWWGIAEGPPPLAGAIRSCAPSPSRDVPGLVGGVPDGRRALRARPRRRWSGPRVPPPSSVRSPPAFSPSG